MQKNVAGQIWVVYAYQDEGGANPGEPVAGDAANITANLHIDGAAAVAVADTNPTELSRGMYAFNLSQAETDGDNLAIVPVSATANVNVVGAPAVVYTMLPRAARVEHRGTLQAATVNTATLEAAPSSAVDNFYQFSTLRIIAGTGAGQARQVAQGGYVGSTRVATLTEDWVTVPDATSEYIMEPWSINAANTDDIAQANWSALRANNTVPGSFGEYAPSDAVRIGGSLEAAGNQQQASESMTPGAVVAGTLSTTQATTDISEAAGTLVNREIIFLTGTLANIKFSSRITANTAAGLLTWQDPAPAAVNPTDTFIIV